MFECINKVQLVDFLHVDNDETNNRYHKYRGELETNVTDVKMFGLKKSHEYHKK